MTGVRILTVVAVIAWLAGVWFEPGRATQAYLWSYLLLIGLPLGSLTWMMVHRLTEGRWGKPLLPVAEAAAATIVPMTFLFLPIALGLGYLYPWAHAAGNETLLYRYEWMNPLAVLIRSSLYFAAWVGMVIFVPRLRSQAPEYTGLALVLHLIVCSSMAVDWFLSLEVHFYSTIFGLLIMVSQALFALCFMVWLLCRRGVGPELLYDLGSLMLVSVMLLAYLSFSQLVIVWSGDLPHHSGWYLSRVWGPWAPLAWMLFLVYLLLPFLCLVWGSFKRDPRRLGRLAALTLVVAPVHVLWLVLPALFPDGIQLHWLDLAALLGLSGLWAIFYQRQERP